MPGYSESGWGSPPPEQGPMQPPSPEKNGSGRIDAFRAAALASAREGLMSGREKGKEAFVNSVESGKAEIIGHKAIDIAAQTAEKSLIGLPAGTRMLGKFVGRRVIGSLESAAHDRLGGALDSVAARVDTTSPYSPPYEAAPFSPTAVSLPTTGWGAPKYEAPKSGGRGGPAPEAAPPPAESWYAQPNPLLRELPPAAKEGLFKSLRGKKEAGMPEPTTPVE